MNTFLKSTRRGQRGAAIAESMCGMILLTMTMIGGVCFLINSGLCAFYKTKLAYVTIETARYAAQLPTGADLETKTRPFANAMLNGIGLPDGQIDVEEVNIEGGQAVKVTIKDTPALMHGVSYLPASVPLTDSAMAPRAPQRDGFLVFRIVPRTGQQSPLGQPPFAPGATPPYQTVFVPMCGRPASGPYFFAGSITPNTGCSTGLPFDAWDKGKKTSDKRFIDHIAGTKDCGYGGPIGGDMSKRADNCTYIPNPGEAPN